MTLKVKLSEIVSNLGIQSDDIEAYLSKKTGKVVIITELDRSELEDYDFLDEDEPEDGFSVMTDDVSDEVRDFFEHEEDYLQLPSQEELHEYVIMEEFCEGVENPQHSAQLLRAIKGSGAFRRFKDKVNELDIADHWYRFRDAAFKEIALEWCVDNQLEYLDDIEIPDENQLIDLCIANEPRPTNGRPENSTKTPEQRIILNANINKARQKPALYAALETQLRALLEGETDPIANAANTAALLYHLLPEVNWAGFYFLRGDVLVLGPFQGQPACVRIPLGKGVCGTAAKERKTLVVPNVEKFRGHIACDSQSKSEIVVPLIKDGKVLGVLDIDSPIFGRFDDIDRKGLEKLVEVLKSLI